MIPLANAEPGDIVAFETAGFFAFFIRLGQRMRKRTRPFYRYTHVAILSDYIENVPNDRGNSRNWKAIQAAWRVDEDFVDDIAKGRPFIVLRNPGPNREAAVEMAEQYLGEEYGVLSILSIAFGLLLPFHIAIRASRTVICSALAAICLLAGGYKRVWPDIYQVKPADIVGVLIGENHG